MSKRINPKKVKLHRSYSVVEAADLFSIHTNTVRNWIKNENLDAIKDGGNWIIVGQVLREFLELREKSRKKPSKRGEIYCLSCKSNQRPDTELIE
ncbi:MAG: helix-turn-helix domain-containing protein [Nitratireductor sp.]